MARRRPARHLPRHRRPSARAVAAARADTLRKLATTLLASSSADDDVLTAVILLELARKQREAARSAKWGPRGPYNHTKSSDIFDIVLNTRSDRQFKTWFRVDRTTFWHLCDLIKDDPIFVSTGQRPQRPVHHQLAAFLARAGMEPGVKTATVLAIAEGTAYLYQQRVCRALRNIRDDFLAWPGPERRAHLRREMRQRGFPGCLGAGDGTLIPLTTMPRESGPTYYSRKQFYALSVLAVCDHRRVFLAYDFGWPGCVTDSTVWNESHIWQHKHDYFRRDEYVLVDKGYPLTAHSIRPFADNELTHDAAEAERRTEFNKVLSHERVVIEHAFGALKGRFPCLRRLAGWNMDFIYRFLEALFILHNICEEFGDSPFDIENFNGKEDEVVVEAMRRMHNAADGQHVNRSTAYRQGLLRRKRLMAHLGL